MELLDRLAALVPPPHIHRHRTSACARERPLTGIFRGDLERQDLADCRQCLRVFEWRLLILGLRRRATSMPEGQQVSVPFNRC